MICFNTQRVLNERDARIEFKEKSNCPFLIPKIYISNAYKLIQNCMHVYLTAAHCVSLKGELLRAEDFMVYLGRYNLRKMNEESLQYHDVSNFNIIC
jgi:hypothetical protein